jgi:ArsR family transcriptional regulator, lead/cadmium/zinc/bismuth-responsive transcriptional repressor
VTPDADACDLLCLDLAKAERVRHSLRRFEVEPSARGARALGDPTRLRLAAAMLAADELCVCDLAWIVERSDKLVSHHLRILREAGIAETRRDGKVVFYQLTDTGRRLLGAIVPDVLGVSV